MKLFIFADPHYGRSPLKNKNRYPRLSLEKLKTLEEKITECDALVCLGDLTDDGKRDECAVCLREISGYIHSVADKAYVLMGNHDCINFSKEQFHKLGSFESRAPFILKDKESTLVFLDANFLTNGSGYLYSNVDWTDSVIPNDQTELIREVVGSECKKIFIFVHQCLAPNAEYRHRIKNFEEIHNIFSSADQKVTVVQGHYHYGGNATLDGVEYITLPALCVNDTTPYLILDTDGE